MGIFDKVISRLSRQVQEDMIENMTQESRPYLYLSIVPFGGHDQDLPPEADAIPAEILEHARDNGGLISFSSHLDKPDPSSYLNGVLCTFHARSRMEAAGALLAFTALTDERLEASVMQTAIDEISSLDLTTDEATDESKEIFEFTKSPEGELMIAFPTQDDKGEMDFSGTFVSLSAPRRTDSEVARMVVKASATIYGGNILPALMCSLHADIESYGVLSPGVDPRSFDGD